MVVILSLKTFALGILVLYSNKNIFVNIIAIDFYLYRHFFHTFAPAFLCPFMAKNAVNSRVFRLHTF